MKRLLSAAGVVFLTALMFSACGGGGGGGSNGGGAPLATGLFSKTTPTAVSYNYYPWNTNDVKMQLLYPANQVNGSGNIKAIRFQLANNNGSAVTCPGTTIRLAHTLATALTTTFANNLAGGKGSFVTVLNVVTVTIPIGTMNSWFEIPFTTTFNYNGVDNLLVQIEKTAACSLDIATNTGNVASTRVYSYAADGNPAIGEYNAHTAGIGPDGDSNTLQFVFAGGTDAVIRSGAALYNVVPFSITSRHHVQMLHLASEINGSGPITGLGMVARGTTPTVAGSYKMTVKLGHALASALTTTFAANFKDSPVTVASAMTFTIPAGNPAGTVIWLPITGAFNYNGTDNLIVDIQVDAVTADNGWQARTSGANVRLLAYPGDTTGILDNQAYDTVFRFNGGTIDVLAADFAVNLSGSNQVFGTASAGGGQVQNLYDNTLLGTAGTINSVSVRLYNNSSTAATLTNFKVYMGHTGKAGYSLADSYASNMNENKLVYSGAFTIPAGLEAGDWITIPLQTPFTYDPSKNLSILFTSDNNNSGSTNLNVIASFTDPTRFPAYAVGTDDNAVFAPSWFYPGGVCVRLGITR